MSKYASGKNSWAISDRSGFRYPYRVMKREWNGLFVGPEEFDPKQPQLGPFPEKYRTLKPYGMHGPTESKLLTFMSEFRQSKMKIYDL